MKTLRDKLTGLGLTYADIAKLAGKSEANVGMYFSAGQRGLPQWAEDATREALIGAGVPAAEVETLIAGWKADRMEMHKGTTDAETLTTDEQIRSCVKNAFALPAQAAGGLKAMQRTIMAGAKVDEAQSLRVGKAYSDNLMADSTAIELRRRLWQERLAAAKAEAAKLDADMNRNEQEAAALEAAIAGNGDEAILLRLKELGIEPTGKLAIMRGAYGDELIARRNAAQDRVREWNKEPLHPGNGQAVTFATDMARAVEILQAPWLAEDPAVCLELFALREVLSQITDMAKHVRETMLANGLNIDAAATFTVGHYGHREDTSSDTWTTRRRVAIRQRNRAEVVLFEQAGGAWITGQGEAA